MDITSIKKNARQYLALKDEISLLTNRQTELKNRLLSALEEVKPNDRGHKVITVEDEIVGEIKLTRQRRVNKTLDMNIAEEILTKKGIKDTCVKMVPVLDESAIMSAFYEGYLTEEDIDAMFPAKESFAFILDK